MRDLELWPSEKFVATDQFWLEVVRNIDPDVRRDMLGWFKCPYSEPKPPSRDFNDAVLDYLRGAAQVINLFPVTRRVTQPTPQAMQRDVSSLQLDAMLVNVLVRNCIEEYCKSGQRTERSKQPVSK